MGVECHLQYYVCNILKAGFGICWNQGNPIDIPPIIYTTLHQTQVLITGEKDKTRGTFNYLMITAMAFCDELYEYKGP
jgi:hypothetical protein